MLLATALALLITGCAQQTFTVQTNRQQCFRETITIISSFLGGEKKTVDAATKFGGAEMLLKQKPSKHS